MFGLKESDIETIRDVLQQFPEVEEAVIYGSRAKGTQKKGSDVDLALKGKALNRSMIGQISYILNEETLMPYYFDVLNFHTLSNKALEEHINRIGKRLYQKSDLKVLHEPDKKFKRKS